MTVLSFFLQNSYWIIYRVLLFFNPQKLEQYFQEWSFFKSLNSKAKLRKNIQSVKVKVVVELLNTLYFNFFFLKQYYRLNDLIWQDGFLIDFLQKKVVDKWIRTFVIYSGYLFSDRFLFDMVTRFYIDLVIHPTYQITIYEFTNISSTLTLTLLLLKILFIILTLNGLFFFIF